MLPPRSDEWSLPTSNGILNLSDAGSGMADLDGLIGAEEKVINGKNKVDENVVSPLPVFSKAKPDLETN